MSDSRAALSAPALDPREQAILRTLGEPGAVVAFQGLRIHLGLHPEILSRILRRLERGGWVERTEGGYRRGSRAALLEETPEPPGVPILEARLPPGVSAEGVLESLEGRWLGPLRWKGVRDHGTRLQWISSEGRYRVDLRAFPDGLAVEVYAEEEAWAEAVRAAYVLFGQVAGRLNARAG